MCLATEFESESRVSSHFTLASFIHLLISVSVRASFLFVFSSFFFNDTATTEIYTLSLHDALPIWTHCCMYTRIHQHTLHQLQIPHKDRKSTRLNSSHQKISYAVFCLKKKNEKSITTSVTELTKEKEQTQKEARENT